MEEEAKADKQPARQKNKGLQGPSSPDHSTPHGESVTGYPDVNCALGCSIHYAICLMDNEGKIISTNPYLEHLLGFKKKELQGKQITDFLVKPSAREFSGHIRNSRQATATMFEAELKTREGSGIWVNFNVTSFTDEKIGSTYLLAGITDITDRKHLTDDLSLCTDVLDTAPDAIFLRDAEGAYLYANETACKERGYTRDEMLKLNLYQIVAPEAHAEVRDRVRNAFARGRVSFNSVHMRKDGSKFPVEVHLSSIEHGGKKLLLSIVHNRTQRKKIEEELMRALKMESVVLLSSGIASQFNTLLTHILGNLNVLLSETESRTTQSRLLEETTKIVDKAHEMVRHLSSLSTSGAPFKKTSQVGTLLKDTAEYVLTGSNTWSNFFIADNLHTVELDQAQFIQAFTNIILNASQSMPKGGVINVAASNVKLEDDEVSDLPEGSYIKISVTDKGHGINPEDMQHIFDPYFTTRQGKMGLGLSIAYSVIRNHGGAIIVDSEHGKGSSFHVFLPASTEEAIKEPAPAKQRHPGVKILLVDDEEVVRAAGNRVLSKLGYDMIEFASEGQEALNKYQQAMEDGKPYDTVVIDLTLPGEMGGKEVIKALHKLDPEANIIVSSGYFNDPILTDFRRYGIKGVLAKPYQIKELEIMLHESPHHHEVAR
ncbi:MAG: PAS domain S-box protein [Dehalococcoidia bacterium]|nr:PAS domain S-box protein [Dehalococcoidia bacterium]